MYILNHCLYFVIHELIKSLVFVFVQTDVLRNGKVPERRAKATVVQKAPQGTRLEGTVEFIQGTANLDGKYRHDKRTIRNFNQNRAHNQNGGTKSFYLLKIFLIING